MKRPLPFRVLPRKLAESVYYRWFNPAPKRWFGLFENAELRHAPGVLMRLVPTDVLHGCLAFTGEYERSLTRRVVDLGRKGGLMVDVGANAGYFSLLWAAANKSNNVIAFEPSPRNVELLRHNIDSNGFKERAVLHACAAGKEAGSLEFALGPEEQTGWGGFAASDTDKTISVNVKTLDSVVEPETTVSLLKVDTEGADTWVLMGCESLLRERRIDEIRFEQNKPRMSALGIAEAEAAEFLRDMGYDAKPVSDANSDVVDWTAKAS